MGSETHEISLAFSWLWVPYGPLEGILKPTI